MLSKPEQEAAAEAKPATQPKAPVEETAPPKACCMAMTAQCLSCSADMSPEQYCNQAGLGAGVQAADCDEYFNCMTREVFNARKQAYCAAQMAQKPVTLPAPVEEPAVEEPVTEEPAAEPTEAPAAVPASAKSCAELGWATADGKVCAASKINKACFPGGSLADAQSFCESAGARLCSTAELAADVAKGTGCKADDAAVFAYEGAIAGGSARAAVVAKSSTASHARCCADVVASGATTVRISGATTMPARVYTGVGGIATVARPYGDAHSTLSHTDVYRTSSTGAIPARTYSTGYTTTRRPNGDAHSSMAHTDVYRTTVG